MNDDTIRYYVGDVSDLEGLSYFEVERTQGGIMNDDTCDVFGPTRKEGYDD